VDWFNDVKSWLMADNMMRLWLICAFIGGCMSPVIFKPAIFIVGGIMVAIAAATVFTIRELKKANII
jgi:hypothetical protein